MTAILRLHGVVLSHPLMMVTELAPLGSLLDYLHKECSHTSICSLWQFASEVNLSYNTLFNDK
jgi:activated CDC42 kinase 1